MGVRSSNALLPAAAVVAAALLGAVLGPFWVIDNFLLAVAAISVIVFCLLKVEPSLWSEGRRPVVRSRVDHYSQLVRTKRPAVMKRYASNEFEKALLSMTDVRHVSEEELRRIITSPSEPPTQMPRPSQALR